MTKKDHMTKKELANYKAYLRSNKRCLHDCYGSYSDAKAKAWDYCIRLFAKMDGSDLKIVSYNSQFFSAGFTYEDPDTKELMYMHITKFNDLACPVPAEVE